MTITTYAELKVAIQGADSFSKRQDVLSLSDTFIDIAESTMYGNPDCSLRIRDMETRATGSTSTSTRYVTLPTRYLQMRQAKLNLSAGDYFLTPSTPEAMPIANSAGVPTEYCITNQIELNCVSDAVYTIEFLYYQTLAPLTDAAPTNAILTRFPQIYLYGAMFALAQWALNPEMEARYYGAFIKAIQGANNQDRRGRYHQPSIRPVLSRP